MQTGADRSTARARGPAAAGQDGEQRETRGSKEGSTVVVVVASDLFQFVVVDPFRLFNLSLGEFDQFLVVVGSTSQS